MKRILIVIIVTAILAVLLGVGVYHSVSMDNSIVETLTLPVESVVSAGEEPTQKPRIQVDVNVEDFITPAPGPTLPGVAIPGWGSIILPAGTTEAAVALNNPEINAGWYDLVFELRLKETGEVIFTTELVPPGQYCNKVTLTRVLEPGEYAAVMHVQPYMQDEEQTPTNNADMETVLIVK